MLEYLELSASSARLPISSTSGDGGIAPSVTHAADGAPSVRAGRWRSSRDELRIGVDWLCCRP